MSHQQQQDAAAGNANGSSGRQSAASSVLEPKTYIDPSADTVLRSNDGGRDFRVNSYMLKANS
jgi:hypothetical protein